MAAAVHLEASGSSPVQLEVQLADPYRELLSARRPPHQVVIKLVDPLAHVDFRDLAAADVGVVGDGPAPTEVLEHRREWPAAAVAVAERQEAGRMRLERLVVAPGVEDVVDRGLGRVLRGSGSQSARRGFLVATWRTHRVLRAHVDDDLRLILPLPAEARVWELVELCGGRRCRPTISACPGRTSRARKSVLEEVRAGGTGQKTHDSTRASA